MRLKIALTSTGQGGEVMRTRFAVRLAVTVAAVILAFPPMPVLALSAVCTGTSQVFNANGTAPNGSEQAPTDRPTRSPPSSKPVIMLNAQSA